ncbi:MAG TPA: hypothetical protein VMW52_05120 [Phycisphaerae bacterium]|nr:hypothetical protein [Phycisphaerae bacterium]
MESEHQRELQRQAVKRGFYFKPFIPLQITGDFFFQEPSAVEQLAAIADPNSDAARRVRAWEEAKEQERVITESVDYWPP